MDISFVVIGYNEAACLSACLASIRNAKLKGIAYEIIYTDGGSADNSRAIARDRGADKILGGDQRRRAAENRNLGLTAAKGQFIQFVDGDMTLDADWPKAALAFLQAHPRAAAVCGLLKEVNPSTFYQALQIDWHQKTGEIAYCGGAALWRRDILEQIHGFPESIPYGEEPYLCWRVRNELGYQIFSLDHPMANHNLDYRGLVDYWQRSVRCGETYAEIAALCFATKDRLWLKETVSNLLWATLLMVALLLLIMGPFSARMTVAISLCLILFRKTLQWSRQGRPLGVSACYALHVYFSKLPLAWGEVRLFSRLLMRKAHSS